MIGLLKTGSDTLKQKVLVALGEVPIEFMETKALKQLGLVPLLTALLENSSDFMKEKALHVLHKLELSSEEFASTGWPRLSSPS